MQTKKKMRDKIQERQRSNNCLFKLVVGEVAILSQGILFCASNAVHARKR